MGKKQPVDYVAKITDYDWADLEVLWKRIEDKPGSAFVGWAKGKAFEHLILRAFQLEGAEVIWPYPVDLEGQIVEQIDGMVECDGFSCLIEAKDWDRDLNIEPLAKLRNQLLRRPAGVLGSVFTSGGFTDPAKTLAKFMAPQAILLWQGPEITSLLAGKKFRAALKWKYSALAKAGIPDWDVRAGAPK